MYVLLSIQEKEKIPETKEHRERQPRSNQKLKIMYLMKILMAETDEEHSLTLQQIVEKLNACGVTAERKSLYSDIDNLRLLLFSTLNDAAFFILNGAVSA